MKFLLSLAALSFAAAQNNASEPVGGDRVLSDHMHKSMMLKRLERARCEAAGECPVNVPSMKSGAATPCVDGKAGDYECSNVDMLSFISLQSMGCTRANDIWGWTDPADGTEYAIFGCTDATTFIDLKDPLRPDAVAIIKSHNNVDAIWRDIKVFNDRAYIVSEANNHGMQVFDLKRLRDLPRGLAQPTNIEPDYRYTESGHGSSHNMVINEETGFGYSVGTRTCSGGLHMIDLNTEIPTFAGCFSSDGYTHDAECVVYKGPDSEHTGKEICFNYNEDTLTIVDVSDKSNPSMLSRLPYFGATYTHQGWLTEDSAYLLLNDELDEQSGNGWASEGNTITYIWDVRDLDNPEMIGHYKAEVTSIDHNLYVRDNYVYEANYESGLRILDVSDIANANLVEAGFFDVRPESTRVQFNGAWSVYPYFASETVVVSSIERGFFALKFNAPEKAANTTALA